MVADDLLCQRTMRREKEYKDLIAKRHEWANVRKPSMNLALSQTKCKIYSFSQHLLIRIRVHATTVLRALDIRYEYDIDFALQKFMVRRTHENINKIIT